MDDPRAGPRRGDHGPARLDDRQRRRADDPRRPPRRQRGAAVDHRRLRAGVRRRPDCRRSPRRHLRPSTAVRDRLIGVRRRVDGVRVRADPGDADRLPPGSGSVGGAADPPGSGDRPQRVRGSRPSEGVHRVRSGDRTVSGAGSDHRWRADRGQRVRQRLAPDLLRQPAAWADRGDRCGAADARVPLAQATHPRRRRHAAGGAGDGAADLPADPGSRGRMADLDLRDDRRERGVVRGAGAVGPSGAPSWPRPPDRGQHLQAPLLQRRPGHDRRVLRRNDRHPAGVDVVPAARRALLGHPRRRHARAVRRSVLRSAPPWPGRCWCRNSAGPCCRWRA